MAQVCHDTKEVRFKITIAGAAGSGKASLLQHLNRRLDPYLRTELGKATRARPRLQLDFLPIHKQEIPGYRSRFQLVTASSCSPNHLIWTSLLQDCDGMLFIADAAPSRIGINQKAFKHFQSKLGEQGIDPRYLPTAFLYNKQDLAVKTAPEQMDELFHARAPSYLTCTLTGHQVFSALDYLIDLIASRFHTTHSSSAASTITSLPPTWQAIPSYPQKESTMFSIGL